MAGLLDSIWPYIPPGFREAIFGGNDYTQRQPSPGLAPAQASPTQRPGLLSPLMEMSPGADIRDAVGYSDSSFNNLAAGNIGQGLLDMAYIPASLAGIMLPGSSSQYRKAGGAVTDALDAARRIEDPIRAYHSSPHDFDQFEVSPQTMRSGEGHQKFGAGAYLAENPATAVDYRRTIPYRHFVREFTKDLPDDAEFDDVIGLIGTGQFTPKQERVIRALAADDWLGFDYPAQAISAAFSKNLDNWDPSQELRDAVSNAGITYEVAIHARPDEFVDFDPALLGKESELKAAGVPGFRYPDQGSRGTGAGTHNYVVFDDKLIEILRKYGLLGPMLGGAAATGILGGGDDQAY